MMAVAGRAPREGGADVVEIAVPVGARDTCERLGHIAERVVCLAMPEPFDAVGLWYEEFGQTSDEEVVRLLAIAPEEATDRVESLRRETLS